MMRDGIVIHCSATPAHMDVGEKTIRQWHEQNGWSDTGYHYVVRRSGTIEVGRPFEKKGAHARGRNDWIGICLIGGVDDQRDPEDNFTAEQWEALHEIVGTEMFRNGIPRDNVIGHNEISDKACPSFDVRVWVEKEFG